MVLQPAPVRSHAACDKNVYGRAQCAGLTIVANVAIATGPSLLGGPAVLRVKFVFRI